MLFHTAGATLRGRKCMFVHRRGIDAPVRCEVFSETRQFIRTAVRFAIEGMVNVQLTAAVFSSISIESGP